MSDAMPTSPTPDDLLALVRACWPHRTWEPWLNIVRSRERADDRIFEHTSRHDVAAAEAVLIERGLGEKYAKRVALILRREDTERPRGERHDFSDVLLGLVAPLSARVRAMAQAIEEAKR